LSWRRAASSQRHSASRTSARRTASTATRARCALLRPALSQGWVHPGALVRPRSTLRYFKFIGQLMAKALADGRTLDLPLSPVVYRWLLGQEAHLTLADVAVCHGGTGSAKSAAAAAVAKLCCAALAPGCAAALGRGRAAVAVAAGAGQGRRGGQGGRRRPRAGAHSTLLGREAGKTVALNGTFSARLATATADGDGEGCAQGGPGHRRRGPRVAGHGLYAPRLPGDRAQGAASPHTNTGGRRDAS